jgi:hypothetical protein
MPLRIPTVGAFNQADVPTIACFNKATVALGADLDKLIAAMQAFVDHDVAPVWGTPAGSTANKKSFAKEDRRGHRSEQRKSGKLLRADIKAYRAGSLVRSRQDSFTTRCAARAA